MRKILLTLIVLFICITVSAQWSDDPAVNNRVSPTDRNAYSPQFKVNKDGITYIFFIGNVSGDIDGVIENSLQILDKNGKKLFPDEGKIISDKRNISYSMVNQRLMVDTDGNAIIAITDCRNSPSDEYDLSYSIYKVSPTGEMLWGEEGVDLLKGHAYSKLVSMSMIQLEDGSYLFAWFKPSGVVESGEIYSIEVERLSKDGDFLWDAPLVLKDDETTYMYPYLVNAGNNQAIMVYSKGTNQDIMAKKIDFDGSSVWATDTRIYRGGFTTVPLHTILQVLPDTKGGVYVSWFDDRFFTNTESVYISNVKPDGTLAFPEGMDGVKVGISDNFRSMNPKFVYNEKEDCLYFMWRDVAAGTSSTQRLMIQKVAASSELLWNPEGMEVIPVQTDFYIGDYSIQNAEDGHFVIFYITTDIYSNPSCYVEKFNSDGESLWNPRKVAFTTNEAKKNHLWASPLIDGDHWITMWEDLRDDNEKAVLYMQYIKTDATIGTGIEAMTKADNKSEITYSINGEKATFNINSFEDNSLSLNIYSLTGQKLHTVYDGQMSTGNHQLDWNLSGIPTGVYLATMTTHKGVKTIRILVNK